MGRHQYILKIQNPCKEDWNSMTENGTGKYCSNCSKSVTDFVSMTDSEIISFLESNSGKICGRLSPDQIDRLLKNDTISQGSSVYKYLAGLLLVTTTQISVADNPTVPISDIQSVISNDAEYEIGQAEVQSHKDTTITIEGVLVDDSTGEPIVFANVLLKDTKIGTTTDFDGNFRLEVPNEFLTNEIVLEAQVIGYVTSQVKIAKDDLPVNRIKISMSLSHALLGEVVIIKKKKWWQRKRKTNPNNH